MRESLRDRNRLEHMLENTIAPRKVKISNRIRQMSGRFDVPADIDKELYSPEEAYEMTMKDIKAVYENKDAV